MNRDADMTETRSVLRLSMWLLRYAQRRKLALAGVFSVMLLRAGFDVLKPWPMKVLVDHVLNHEPTGASTSRLIALLPGASDRSGLLMWCVAGTVALFVLSWTVTALGAFANIGFGQRMTFDLAADLFRHLQRLSLRFHSRFNAGDLARRVTADSSCVATIVKDAILPVLTSVVMLVIMFCVMWRMSPPLTLLSIAIVPLMAFAFHRYAKPMNEHSYEQQQAEGKLYDVIDQNLSAISVVQAFGREDHGDGQFARGAGSALTAALATTRVQLAFRLLIGLCTAAGTAGILCLGAIQVIDGKLSVGSLLVFLAYLGSLYGPLESIMYTGSTIHGAAGSARRVLEVLEKEPDVRDRAGAKPLRTIRGHVRMESVTFGYEPGTSVLQDITFEAKPGELIAIVGPTGAGKSTLMSLIPRLFDPWHGRITIDGNNLVEVTIASVRAQIAVVQQEPFLFPMTIAQNIAYGRPDATREAIVAAAKTAHAHAFIERLSQGYDTLIGERGATLSGGERQRISIARALLKDAPILILDEPTSALDAATEASLVSALAPLMRDRTVFAIAHRLSTLRRADRVIVLDRGQITEIGTHETLLALGGLYAQFHAIQFAGVERAAPVSTRGGAA